MMSAGIAGLLSTLPIFRPQVDNTAGPLSQWLYRGLAEAGFSVELIETRHVRDAFKAMPVKTDRNDARGIALALQRCIERRAADREQSALPNNR